MPEKNENINLSRTAISDYDVHYLINTALHHSLLYDPVVTTWPSDIFYVENFMEQLPLAAIQYAWSGIADTSLISIYNHYEDSLIFNEIVHIDSLIQSFTPVQRVRFDRIDHFGQSSYEKVPTGYQVYYTFSDFYINGKDLYFILGINSLLFVKKPKDVYHSYFLAHAEICESNYFVLTELIAGTTFQVPEGNSDPMEGRPVWRIPHNPCLGEPYKK